MLIDRATKRRKKSQAPGRGHPDRTPLERLFAGRLLVPLAEQASLCHFLTTPQHHQRGHHDDQADNRQRAAR